MFPETNEGNEFLIALTDSEQTASGPNPIDGQGWDFLKEKVSDGLRVLGQLFSSADSPADATELFPAAPQE